MHQYRPIRFFFNDAVIFSVGHHRRVTWVWHVIDSSTRFELLHKMFRASFWYSESTPDIAIAFSSSPKFDHFPFYTFFDWFLVHFQETKGKKIVDNITKHNKAKLMRKLWFYRLLMVSLLCGSQGESVSTRKHRWKAMGHSPRFLKETPFLHFFFWTKPKTRDLSRYLNFISSYEFLNFEFLQFFETQNVFGKSQTWTDHRRRMWLFLQKNAFSRPFKETNWNKGVLQQSEI